MLSFLVVSVASDISSDCAFSIFEMPEDKVFKTDVSLKKGEFLCFYAIKCGYVLLGATLDVKGLKTDNTEIAEVKNAYAFADGLFMATATEDVKFTVGLIGKLSGDTQIGRATVKENVYVALKKEFDVKLNVKYDPDTMKGERDVYCVINPSKAKITVTPTDAIYVQSDQESTIYDDKKEYETKFDMITTMPKDISKSTEGSVDLSVKSDSAPDKYPEAIFLLESGKIYPTGSDDDDDKLSAGAIAGIVIGCVVGVGIIVFCVVWFAVLKKGCCAATDAPAA